MDPATHKDPMVIYSQKATTVNYSPKAVLATRGPSVIAGFTPDGMTLATYVLYRPNFPTPLYDTGPLQLWDVSSGKERISFMAERLSHVQFSPVDALLAAAVDRGGTIKLWDAVTGKEQATLSGHAGEIKCLTVTSDGKTLASAGADYKVKLWKVAAGKLHRTLDAYEELVVSVGFFPDGRTVALGDCSGAVRLWDAVTEKRLAVLEKHRGYVRFLALTPDGKTLVSGSWDGVKLWDVETKKERAFLRGHTDVNWHSLTADGKTLATGNSDGTVKLWDVDTGQGHTILEHGGLVSYIEFAPGDQILAVQHVQYGDAHGIGDILGVKTPVKDRKITLWEVATGQELATLEGAGLSFSPDGTTLATLSVDEESVKLWDMPLRTRW
jgi:WD40 repeat protein